MSDEKTQERETRYDAQAMERSWNQRWLADPKALSQISPDAVGIVDGTVVYLTLDPLEVALLTGDNWDEALPQIARTRRRVAATGKLARYPWDLVHHNPEQLKADFVARDFDLSSADELGPQSPSRELVLRKLPTVDSFGGSKP